MKILIIEDDESVRNELVALLKDKFEIATAKDGEEGIEMIGKFKPRLVITDFRMPKRNGIEVVRHIRLSKLNIKTIIISADDIESVAKAAGADMIIRKPFGLKEITQAINDLSL